MGTVYLIGAGPGDPGLLTRRGARVLRRADVVVHDALIDERVLALAPAHARRIDVGKRGGGRHTRQEDINRLLIEEAACGGTVVRLKGGDPFVFGRGAEEVRALAQAGVRTRIIPGITSGLGGLASAGIPATIRGVASAVTLVTGHGAGADPLEGVDWRALACSRATLVVYMGTRTIARVAGELMAGGLPPETSAAVIERATWPDERVVVTTLRDIAETALHAEIAAPALFVIGNVVDAGVRSNGRKNGQRHTHLQGSTR